MQYDKVSQFKICLGKVIKELRTEQAKLSLDKLAYGYDFDKGNLSKTENGLYSIYLITAYRLSEALGIKFSDFAKALEDELGDDFSFYDD